MFSLQEWTWVESTSKITLVVVDRIQLLASCWTGSLRFLLFLANCWPVAFLRSSPCGPLQRVAHSLAWIRGSEWESERGPAGWKLGSFGDPISEGTSCRCTVLLWGTSLGPGHSLTWGGKDDTWAWMPRSRVPGSILEAAHHSATGRGCRGRDLPISLALEVFLWELWMVACVHEVA